MDSHKNPHPLSESMQWQEHTGPLPLSPQKPLRPHPHREAEEGGGSRRSPSSEQIQTQGLPPEALEHHRMMRQLSVTLRKNLFLSQRVQSLKKDHLNMTEKNTLLQNEFLKLNKKHQQAVKENADFRSQLKTREEELQHQTTSFHRIQVQLENQKKWEQARELQNHKLTMQCRSETLQHQKTSNLLKEQQKKSFNLNNEVQQLKHQLHKQNQSLHLLRKTFKALSWQHQQKKREFEKNLLSLKRETRIQNRHLARVQIKHQKDLEALKQEQEGRLKAALNTQGHKLNLIQKNHQQQSGEIRKHHHHLVQQLNLKHQKEVRHKESFRLHFVTLLRKYKHLKSKWHQRIKNLSKKHSVRFSALKAKYKNLKHQMNKEALKQLQKLKTQHEGDISKIKQDHSLALANTAEQKDILIKNQEAKNLSLQDRYRQKEQQLKQLTEDNKNLSQTRQEESQKHQNEKQNLQHLVQKQEGRIQDLNHEVENLNKNYIDYEQKLATKWEARFVQIQIELNTQKQEELSQLQNKYERQITEQNSGVEQKWRELKDQYDLQLREKEASMESRVQDLKEEQEDSLHRLRVEMENELIAQKRNFTALNQSQITDRDKLQKDLKQTQAKLELKSFQITHLETEIQTLTRKSNSLKKHNQKLKDKNLSLQILWEKQWPEMEQQKHQIAGLRRLNRQLSLSLQERVQQKTTSSPSAGQSTTTRSRDTHRHTLREIHIHNPS